MARKVKPTMTWEEAPDTITPEVLAKILGRNVTTVREKYFGNSTFPTINNEFIADKEAARLWCQGLYKKRR